MGKEISKKITVANAVPKLSGRGYLCLFYFLSK